MEEFMEDVMAEAERQETEVPMEIDPNASEPWMTDNFIAPLAPAPYDMEDVTKENATVPESNDTLLGEGESKKAFDFVPPTQEHVDIPVAEENQRMTGVILYPKLEKPPELLEIDGKKWYKMEMLNVLATTCITNIMAEGLLIPVSMFSSLLCNPSNLPPGLWLPWHKPGVFAQTKVVHAEANSYTILEAKKKTHVKNGKKHVTVHPDWLLVDYFTSNLIGNDMTDVRLEFCPDNSFPLRLHKIIVYETEEHVEKTKLEKEAVLTKFHATLNTYYEKVVLQEGLVNVSEEEKKKMVAELDESMEQARLDHGNAVGGAPNNNTSSSSSLLLTTGSGEDKNEQGGSRSIDID